MGEIWGSRNHTNLVSRRCQPGSKFTSIFTNPNRFRIVIESIDKNIGKNYSRIRIGIGRPKNNSTGADHVLDDFSKDEKENVNEVTKNIIEALSILINKDLDLFSSKINQK